MFLPLRERPQQIHRSAVCDTTAFFDPGDLVRVEHEMLRRVQSGGHSVTGAAFRLVPELLLPGALCFGTLAGLVVPKRDPQRGAQTARRKTGLHRRHTPERTVRKPQSLDGHRPTSGLAPALLVLLVRCGVDRLVLFLQRAMTAWMQAWSQCVDHVPPTAHPQRAAAAPFA